MASIRASGRDHLREWWRQYARMVAVKKQKTQGKQGKRIMNQIELNIYFSQIINILFHTDLTNLTEARIVSLACAFGMQTFDEVDKHERSKCSL